MTRLELGTGAGTAAFANKPVLRPLWGGGDRTGTPAEYVDVIFEDVAPSVWAGAGKLFGAEPSATTSS